MKTPLVVLVCLLLAAAAGAADHSIVIGGLDGLDPSAERPRYSVLLALGGGGIRGIASIGVLQAFQEKGIGVAGIAGTSMGGIVGGLYAAGYSPDELESIARQMDFEALFQNAPPRSTMLQTRRREHGRDLLTVRFDGYRPRIPQALTSAQYLTNFLTIFTARATYRSGGDFNRLRVPFAAVSTDVVSGDKVVLRGGSLADAMRATMAFPLAFTGLEVDGRLLMDGGMVDPIPVALARELSDSTDFVVAVNTASPLIGREELRTPIDIANQVTSIMTAEHLAQSLRQADYVIAPARDWIRSTDYRYCDSLIAMGYRAGLAAADSILHLLAVREESACVTIVGVTCDSVMAPYCAALDSALMGESCTRGKITDQLLAVASDSTLFRIEAAIAGAALAESASADYPAYRLHVSASRSFAPGTVSFSLLGNTMFEDSALLAALALSDSVITPERLRRGLERMMGRYRDRGWDLASVERVVIEPDRSVITVMIDEAIIRGVEVEGRRRTRPWYIRAHFPLSAGDPFSTRRASAGLKNIYGTDLFERVTVDLAPGETNVVRIRVEEKAYRQVRLGWHWDDEYDSEEFIELLDDNIAGIGLEALLHARYSPDRQDYNVGFKADRIFKTYLTSRVRAYHTVLDRHLYDDRDSVVARRTERTSGAEFRLGQQIARLGTVTGALIVEEIEHEHEIPAASEEHLGLRILELESLVETFDRVPFPHSGKKSYFELQQAGKLVGGEVEFTRFFTSLEAYFPIGDRLAFHPLLSGGLSRPSLPWSEKFYLGGMYSFAGYRTHQLAGDNMFLMSAELRLSLPLRLYLTARYDLGDVWSSSDELKFETLRHGAAVLLSLDSPLGPFEAGYGVNDDTDRFYLRAGFDF